MGTEIEFYRFMQNLEMLDRLSDQLRLGKSMCELMLHHLIFQPDRGDKSILIQCDDSALVNHSEDPNIKTFKFDYSVAIKDIEAGEEILDNYNDSELALDSPFLLDMYK